MTGPRSRRTESPSTGAAPRWELGVAALLMLGLQLVFLPNLSSAFRLPKEALALGGLGLLVLGATGVALRRGPILLPAGPLAATLLAYPLLQVASAAWAPSPWRSLGAAAGSAIWVAIIFWLAGLAPADRHRLVRWSATGVAVSGAVLALQIAGAPVLVTRVRGAGERLAMTGLAGNPSDLALAAVLLLPLLLPLTRDRAPRLDLMLAATLAAAAAATQSLTGLVALAATGIVWAAVRPTRMTFRVVAAAAVIVAGVAAATGAVGRLDTVRDEAVAGNWYQVLSARGDGMSAATAMIRSKPLLGAGAANFTHQFYPARLASVEATGAPGRRGEMATHFEWAHCDPLQVVAELGAAGALWLLALAMCLLRAEVRRSPLLPVAAAAALPFLLMHYPTHVAVGLMPLAFILAEWLPTRSWAPRRLAVRAVLAAALAAGGGCAAWWQWQRVTLDAQLRRLESNLVAVERAEPGSRDAVALAAERQALELLPGTRVNADAVWRLIGKARLLRGEAVAAEEAFRRATVLLPHEEAELGLGLALALQGRRTEAIHHLGRVCRVNPTLAGLIHDRSMREAVLAHLAASAEP